MRRNASKWSKTALALGIALISSAGCQTPTRVEYLDRPLTLPDRPYLPPLPAADMGCLSDDAYLALVTRDQSLIDWGLACEAVILTTHPENEPAGAVYYDRP